MDARRLLYYGDLDERRRRQAQGGLGALSPWLYSVLAAMALAAAVGRGMRVFGADVAGSATPTSASTLWLAALAAGHTIVLLGAPFRLFWRRDSALVGRSAIPGRAVLLVGLIRSARAATRVSLPCAAAALVLALGPYGTTAIALRHLALVGVAFLWAALAGPAIALAAGALVASDKARAALGSLGGEFHAPRSSWLGILPGFGGTALVLGLIALAAWSRGADAAPVGQPLHVLAAGVLAPVLLGAWAISRGDRLMLVALREVAALDQERLAHVETTGPSPIERATGRLLGDRGACLVLEKDASLARRRYPIPFFLGVVGLVAQWIVAVTTPESLLLWASAISAGLGAYGVVMARRSMQPPIEHLRLLGTLAIGDRAATRAKRARVGLWVLVYMVLGAIPVIARAPEPGAAAVLLGAIVLCTLVAGAAATRVAER